MGHGIDLTSALSTVRSAAQNFAEMGVGNGLTVVLSEMGRTDKEVTAMDKNTDDKWLTRQDLADRYGLPVKTPAEWASKGTGPRYAKFGRHVRYLLSDVIDWERKQFTHVKRRTA
jgi:predicted DNA-binding transcriptional regulator AlpA